MLEWRTPALRRQLIFALSGTAGFLVDAGIMQLLVGLAHAQPHLARVVSFLVSMTVTWQINRHFTFREQRPAGSLLAEWRRYFASSLLGGASNYAAFAIAIAVSPFMRAHIILPVAIGCLIGMVTNYVLYSRYVFKSAAGGDRLRR